MKQLMFVGYCEDTKGYRLMDLNTNKIVRARDVIFLENNFSLKNIQDQTTNETIATLNWKNNEDENQMDTPTCESENTEENSESDSSEPEIEESDESANTEENSESDSSEPEIEESDESANAEARRATKLPSKYGDYILYYSALAENVPTSYQEAVQSKDERLWREAMEKEMEAFHQHDVWDLVDPPTDRKVVECKWVYNVITSKVNLVI
ncbi:hypothetical protein QE152_g19138 [Popillia japonica]|uniref:Retroviral polymerase SH3-like domain-containing protein n=1 Tax=Popillia japonica TaxID=7064 RepID=A0AAW1L2Z6_POPJA